MSEVVLSAQNISKSFGGVQAVRDVSLEVKQGMIHAVKAKGYRIGTVTETLSSDRVDSASSEE